MPGPGQGPEPGKSNSKKVEKYETVDCIRMKKPWCEYCDRQLSLLTVGITLVSTNDHFK